MRLSLRYRLLVPPALLLGGVAAGTAWAAVAAADAADRRIAGQIQGVAHALAEPPAFPLTLRVLEQMKNLSGAEFLLVDRSGNRVTTFADPTTPPPDVPDAPPPADTPTLGPPVRVGDADFRGLRVPLRPPHPNEGGRLYVFYPESLRRTVVRDAARPTLVLGAVSGLVAGLLTAVTSHRLVSRIRDLDQKTRDVAGGKFEPLPLPAADDELRDLCRSVNDMVRRLADYETATRRTERLRVLGQFSGGLAHQLRNAAAGARLALQLYLNESPEGDTEPVLVALRQLARIEANLRQFLDLGKPPDAKREPCDLRCVVDQAVALVSPQAKHAGTRVEWDRPADEVAASADAQLLGHLVGNLIGNAVDAAPGGVVAVSLARTPDGVRFAVADTGPGPPAELADRLFEPFVTGRDQGIGLGLAVAKQAADAHGGTLTWTRAAGRTVFEFRLPGS